MSGSNDIFPRITIAKVRSFALHMQNVLDMHSAGLVEEVASLIRNIRQTLLFSVPRVCMMLDMAKFKKANDMIRRMRISSMNVLDINVRDSVTFMGCMDVHMVPASPEDTLVLNRFLDTVLKFHTHIDRDGVEVAQLMRGRGSLLTQFIPSVLLPLGSDEGIKLVHALVTNRRLDSDAREAHMDWFARLLYPKRVATLNMEGSDFSGLLVWFVQQQWYRERVIAAMRKKKKTSAYSNVHMFADCVVPVSSAPVLRACQRALGVSDAHIDALVLLWTGSTGALNAMHRFIDARTRWTCIGIKYITRVAGADSERNEGKRQKTTDQSTCVPTMAPSTCVSTMARIAAYGDHAVFRRVVKYL
jgi:hypothetical protein